MIKYTYNLNMIFNNFNINYYQFLYFLLIFNLYCIFFRDTVY